MASYLVQAEAAFFSKDYFRAASFYAKINYILSFEEVTLKFISAGEQMKYRERVVGLILVSPLCKAPSWTEWFYNKVMSNLLYFYGMCGLLKECLLQRYFSKEVRGNVEVPESEIVLACRKLLDERKKTNVLRFLEAINERPDITEGLKRLKCRTLIFVGDSSPFHSEALHMTSKLDRRFSAFVEDAYFDDDSAEVVISSLRLTDDQRRRRLEEEGEKIFSTRSIIITCVR